MPRAGERRLDVALGFVEIALHVGVRHRPALARNDKRIAFGMRVQHWCVRRDRFFGVEDRRQFLVLHVDGARCRLGPFARFSGDRDDVLAVEANDVDGQNRPIEERAAEVVFADVVSGEYRVDAGHRARDLHID